MEGQIWPLLRWNRQKILRFKPKKVLRVEIGDFPNFSRPIVGILLKKSLYPLRSVTPTALLIYNNQGLNKRGDDLRFGLFRFSDFRKLVFLDHRNSVDISQNLHFYCITKVQFCLIWLIIKFSLEWIWNFHTLNVRWHFRSQEYRPYPIGLTLL